MQFKMENNASTKSLSIDPFQLQKGNQVPKQFIRPGFTPPISESSLPLNNDKLQVEKPFTLQ